MTPADLVKLFPGDSEMARRMRQFDWSNTDLGQPKNWPKSLRIAISLCLTSRIPIVMYWGEDLTVLYNDSYISFLGEIKHPRFLGRPGRECWSELWDTIGPMLEGVRATGQATWSEDVLMFLARRLPFEEVFVRFTFGPILAADGQTVDGIFCPCTETTEQVVNARRLETLRKLAVDRPNRGRGRHRGCGPVARRKSQRHPVRGGVSARRSRRRRKPRKSSESAERIGSRAGAFLPSIMVSLRPGPSSKSFSCARPRKSPRGFRHRLRARA